jgi:hypothetical protein
MAQANAILRVSAGVPVFDRDGQKLGKVAEVRNGSFKVETGLFSPNYWLSGDVVESAVPGDAVMLSIAKANLAAHKQGEPAKVA